MNMRSIKFYLKKPHSLIKKGLYNLHVKLNPTAPWFEPKAVEFLDKTLNKDMTVFEWGSGRSTAWLAQRVKKVVSIEYNKDWFEQVEKDLKENHLENTELKYIPVQQEPSNYTKRPFPAYVEAIDELDQVDLAIVDGHYRRTCVLAAVDKIVPGGYLLIDDSHREPSYKIWGVPENWMVAHQSTNGFMQTSIFQKPKT